MANISRKRLNLITLGILLSLFLSSMEGTVVATAMPTIVAQLGGLAIYSWVFSIYMLASTTTVPIYGKLSDLLGRKQVYAASMALFVAGSLLCGSAQSMEQLILFRAVQGLGAGGVLPLAFTIIGELFTFEQRARMQGVFSAVWGISAVIGPLIGGFLVDQVSWHWVFWINTVPGLAALAIVWFAWHDSAQKRARQVSIDGLGALFLTLGTLALLLGLDELGHPNSLAPWLLTGSALSFGILIVVERRAADPILPLALFRDRLFNVAILHGVLAGWAMFGSLNYVPLFVQAVLGTSATQAGITLTPMSLSWTLVTIIGSRLLLRTGYRSLALAGMLLLSLGALLMALITPATSQLQIMINVSLMGTGMGLSIPAFLIAVQSSVRKDQLGAATSTIQFFRSIGGTLGVSVLGVVLSSRLASNLVGLGVDPASVKLDSLLESMDQAGAGMVSLLRTALAGAVSSLFLTALVAAVLGLVVVFFTPHGQIAHLEQKRASAEASEF